MMLRLHEPLNLKERLCAWIRA